MNAIISYWKKAKFLHKLTIFFLETKKIYAPQNWMILQSSYFLGTDWFFFYHQVSAASFVLRRSKKDMNTLQREVVHGRYWGLNFSKLSFQSGIDIDLKLFAYYCNISIIVFLSIFRNMVRNVKLGHGLFDLIKTEQAAKVSIFKRICNCISHLQLQLYTWITVLLLNHFIVINTLVLY